MGGQTALNLCIECEKDGLWDVNIRTIGVDLEAVEITENRDRFRELMDQIGIGQAPSRNVKSYLEGKVCSGNWVSSSYSSFLYARWYRSLFCSS